MFKVSPCLHYLILIKLYSIKPPVKFTYKQQNASEHEVKQTNTQLKKPKILLIVILTPH